MDTTTTTEDNYDNTGCEGEAVRPVIAMAGRVVAAFATGNTVEIWCQSPTGGETDSLIFHMQCNTDAQAAMIASQWRNRWDIPASTNDA
jgi:hypothetical protein